MTDLVGKSKHIMALEEAVNKIEEEFSFTLFNDIYLFAAQTENLFSFKQFLLACIEGADFKVHTLDKIREEERIAFKEIVDEAEEKGMTVSIGYNYVSGLSLRLQPKDVEGVAIEDRILYLARSFDVEHLNAYELQLIFMDLPSKYSMLDSLIKKEIEYIKKMLSKLYSKSLNQWLKEKIDKILELIKTE